VCAYTVQLTIALTKESIWNNIKAEDFLFVNIGAVLYFRYFMEKLFEDSENEDEFDGF